MKNYIKFKDEEIKNIFLNSNVSNYLNRNFNINNNDLIGEFNIKNFNEFEYVLNKIKELNFKNPIVALFKVYLPDNEVDINYQESIGVGKIYINGELKEGGVYYYNTNYDGTTYSTNPDINDKECENIKDYINTDDFKSFDDKIFSSNHELIISCNVEETISDKYEGLIYFD